MHCHSQPPRFINQNLRLQTCQQIQRAFARALTPRPEHLDHETLGYAVPLAASQPPSRPLATNGNGNDPKHLGSQGPKLLPRPVRLKKDGSSSSNNSSGGGGGGGGGRRPGGMAERTLASLAAYTGLVGTTALVLGKLTGLDLWSEFEWASVDDLRLAAVASIPLQLLHAALLLPSYSPPKQLPDFGSLEALETNLSSEQRRREETESSPPAATAAAEDAAAAAAAAPSAATGSSSQVPSTAPGGLVPADLWGRSRRPASSQSSTAAAADDSWTSLRSALHLAQGYYISNNPTARLSPGAEAAYTLLDMAAGEMLYRGVALTWLASWLQDRVYEAGLDEMLTYQLPAAMAALGVLPPDVRDAASTLGVYGACECAVAAGVAVFVVWSVLFRSRRAAQRLEMIMRVASSSSSSSSSGRAPGSGAAGTKAPGGSGSGGSTVAAATQVLFGPGGPGVNASNAAVVMRRAATIQAARDVFQILVLNGVFIASGGNLAASYTAAVVNQLLISLMQRRGVRRMRERSAALARELRAYNAQMQRIATKYKDKLPKEAASRLEDLGGVEDSTQLSKRTAPAATPPTPSASKAAEITSADATTITTTTATDLTTATTASDSSNGSVNTSSSGNPSISSTSAYTDSVGNSSSNSNNNINNNNDMISSSGSVGTAASSTSAPVLDSVAAGLAVAATTHPAAAAIAGFVDGLANGGDGPNVRSNGSSNGSGSGSSDGNSSSLARALAMLDRLVPEQASSTSNRKQ